MIQRSVEDGVSQLLEGFRALDDGLHQVIRHVLLGVPVHDRGRQINIRHLRLHQIQALADQRVELVDGALE